MARWYQHEDAANEDLGRGRIKRAHIEDEDFRPRLAYEPLLCSKAEPEYDGLEALYSAWRRANSKASVPEAVRIKLQKEFYRKHH